MNDSNNDTLLSGTGNFSLKPKLSNSGYPKNPSEKNVRT